MRTQLVCLSLLLAGLMMSSGGCVVLAVGAGAAGTVAYVKGDLETEVHYGLDQVYTATKTAADDLKLHVITGEGGKDALSAVITARDAADKHVSIKLKTVTQDVTKVAIRIGTFGDQTKQRLIFDKIKDNLEVMYPQPAQATQVMAAAQSSQSPSNAPAAQPAQNPPNPPSPPEPAQTPNGAAAVQPAEQNPPSPSAP